MKPSNLEKMVLRLVEAKLGEGVKAELVRRAELDWKTHYHIKVSGALNTMFLVRADFGDEDYGVKLLHPLHTGKNERLVNLEFSSARWVSIGNCRYSSFNVIRTGDRLELSNKDFVLMLSKSTGDVILYKNTNPEINYMELFLNPETNITAEL